MCIKVIRSPDLECENCVCVCVCSTWWWWRWWWWWWLTTWEPCISGGLMGGLYWRGCPIRGGYLPSPVDTPNTNVIYLNQGFPNSFLEPPQHCTFCMSPLSMTPDWTYQLISSNSKTWNGCVRQRRHTKCAVLGRLQERVWEPLI